MRLLSNWKSALMNDVLLSNLDNIWVGEFRILYNIIFSVAFDNGAGPY